MPLLPVPDYWAVVRQLARELDASRPELSSFPDLLSCSGTVADAAAELTGAEAVRDGSGRGFYKLPVKPTAYCKLSAFVPQDGPLRWPDELALLFNFTSDKTGRRHLQSIEHWASHVANPWMLMLEGPVDPHSNQYDTRTDRPHEWEDAIAAGVRMIEEFSRGRARVGYYFNSLVSLAFEIGLRTTVMKGPRRVYHFNHGSGKYDTAFDTWPA